MNYEINQALRTMAKSPNGGYAVSAAMLGMSQASLENRLYEVKGQQISIEQAMMLQRLTERTDFAEAVAHASGGVFIRLPEIDAAALAGEDIMLCLLNSMEKVGVLSAQWRKSTDDGAINEEERAQIFHTARETAKQVLAVAVLTDYIFGK